MPEQHPAPPVAGYLAQPHEVHRVVLLYSGGLDTSVMLKWIQDEYEAEIVALTINLGQPGEDYEIVKGKAMQLGALDCHVVDAREEFAQCVRQAALMTSDKNVAIKLGGLGATVRLDRPVARDVA